MRPSKHVHSRAVPWWQGLMLFILGLVAVIFCTPLVGNVLQTLIGWTFPVLYSLNDLASLRSSLSYITLLFGFMVFAILFNATIYSKHRIRGLRHVLFTIGWRTAAFFCFCYLFMAYLIHGFLLERKLVTPLLPSGLVEQIGGWLIAAFFVWAFVSHFIDGFKPEVRAARREAEQAEWQRQILEHEENRRISQRWEEHYREQERKEAERW